MKKTAQTLALSLLGVFVAVFFVPETTSAQVLYSQTDGSYPTLVEVGEVLTSPDFANPFLLQSLSAGVHDFAFTASAWTVESGATSSVNVLISSKSTAGNFYVNWCGFTINANEFNQIYYATTTCDTTNKDFSVPSHVEIFPAGVNPKDIGVATSLSGNPFIVWTLGEDPLQSLPPFQLTDTTLGVATTSAESFCQTNFPYDDSSIIQATITYFPNGLCRIGAFLFIPSPYSVGQFSLLASTTQQKIPFSYVYGVQEIFDDLTASTSNNLSAVVLSFPNIATGTPFSGIVPSSIEVLSTSTISTYMSETVRQSLLNLQRIALWAGLAFMFYRRIIPHHATETKHT